MIIQKQPLKLKQHLIFTEEKKYLKLENLDTNKTVGVIRKSLYLCGSLLVLFYVIYLTSIAKKFNLAFYTFGITCCNPVKKS